MYVFGDVQDPLPETTMLVEDIVRSHMLEIVSFFFHLRITKHFIHLTRSLSALLSVQTPRYGPKIGATKVFIQRILYF